MQTLGNCGSIPHTNHRPLPTTTAKTPPKTKKRTYMASFSTTTKRIPTQPRLCVECGNPIPQNKSESRNRYQEKQFCSRTCSMTARNRKAA